VLTPARALEAAVGVHAHTQTFDEAVKVHLRENFVDIPRRDVYSPAGPVEGERRGGDGDEGATFQRRDPLPSHPLSMATHRPTPRLVTPPRVLP
jgi:hypothetical protein